MLKVNELNNILSNSERIIFLLKEKHNTIEEMFGKEAAGTVDFDQRNPHHCYTIFEHCVRTAAYITIESESDLLLRCAALFHDVGKPEAAREKNGRLVFYGHAFISARIMKEVLPKLGYKGKELARILFWIEHHDDFISYTDDKEKASRGGRILISKDSVGKYLVKLKKNNKYGIAEDEWPDVVEKLIKLCKADVSSQSEEAYIDGKLADTKTAKLQRLDSVAKCICECI